jgi:mRNA interferase RelE/StbE
MVWRVEFANTTLRELWKYRIGDYRVIADIEGSVLRVLLVRVGNRKDVYR